MISLALAAAKFIPDIVGWIAGDDAEETARTVVGVVEKVTGLKGQEAVNALENNPEYCLKIKAMALSELELHAKDRASARNMQKALAKTGHVSALAPALLSLIVTSGFFIIIYIILRVDIPEGSGELIYMLLGTLAAAFTQTLNFWLGSSRSSQQKTELMAGK